MDAFEKRVLNFVQKKKLIAKDSRVLVALSGGADSVFLLYFLLKVRRLFNLQIGIAHLNHLLRGEESTRDELFCKALAEENDVPFYFIRKDIRKSASDSSVGIEEAARIERYNFFHQIMQEHGYIRTATAHHLDDNAETVLLNLFKGSGFHGMSGIPAMREGIIRPLLCLTRNDIHQSLRSRKLSWIEDSSNKISDAERNYIRNIIIPAAETKFGGSLASSINNFSGLMNEVRIYADEQTAFLFKKEKSGGRSGSVYNIRKLYKLPSFVRKFGIHEILKNEGANSGFRLTEDIFEKIESKKTFTYQIGEKKMIFVESGIIRFYEEEQGETGVKSIPVNSSVLYENRRICFEESERSLITFTDSPNTEYFGTTERIPFVEVRRWQPGDRFTPLGMEGSRLVSDFLNDLKIPEHLKKFELVLSSEKEIIAVAGRRVSNRFKVSEEKIFIYKIKVE